MPRVKSLFAALPVIGLPLLLAAGVAVFSLLSPERFPTLGTFEAIAFQMPELGLLTLAMLLPFISAGFNLAIIVTANICGLFMAWLWTGWLPAGAGYGEQILWIALGLAGAGAIAAGIGALMGVVIAYFGVHPILVSLGFMTLVRGIGVFLTRGAPISGMPPAIQFIGNGSWCGMPAPLAIFLAVAFVTAVALNRTALGQSVYMIGSNINAAYFAGVNTHGVIVAIYVMSSLIAAAAGVVMNARFNSARMGYGDSYLLLTVLAIIMGGVHPRGGFGKVGGVVLALLILQVVSTGLNLGGVDQYVSLAMWGAILIFVLVVQFGYRRWYAPWILRP